MAALFKERNKRIEGAKEEAKILHEKASEQIKHIEEQVKLAQVEARESMLDLKNQAQIFKMDILQKAKLQAKKEIERSYLEVQKEYTQTKDSLLKESGNFSSSIDAKLIDSNKFKIISSNEISNVGRFQ